MRGKKVENADDGADPGRRDAGAAAKAARDSEARLRDFAEASSDWFWETGADGEITYMSYRNERDISGSDTSRLRLSREAGGDPQDVARDPARWERLWSDLEAHRPFRNFEFPLREKSGAVRFIRASGKPMFDEQGEFTGYRGVGTDVTDVVQGQRQAVRLRDAIDAARDAFSLFDTDGRIVFTNAEFHRRFAHLPPQDSIVGMPLETVLRHHLEHGFIDEPLATAEPDAYLELMLGAYGQVGFSEREMCCADGRTYLCSQRRSADGEALVLYTDITERKETQKRLEHYQDRLRRLASEVSLAEERERHRIAAELHDGALQNLALARIRLGSLTTRLSDSDNGELANTIRDLVNLSIREARTLMSELSPPMLYELGLQPALKWLVQRFKERHELQCALATHGEPPVLSPDVRVLLYQAVRELLANVVKHSGAAHAWIELRGDSHGCRIEVRDDGTGFRVDATQVRPSEQGGFGLFSLRERIELLGGSMRIESDNGGRVMIFVPFPAD